MEKQFEKLLKGLPLTKTVKDKLIEEIDKYKGGGGATKGAVIKAVWIFDNNELVDSVPITGNEVNINLVPYSDNSCVVFTNDTTPPANSYDENVIVCIYKRYMPDEYLEFNHKYTNSDHTHFISNGIEYRIERAQAS